MQFIRFILLICLVFPLHSVTSRKSVIIFIDAGHGGSDPGHLSPNKNLLSEKNLNLLIAKKFGAYVQQYLQHVEIYYSRTQDEKLSLAQRVDQAHAIAADYFISIHCNANAKPKVHGTESHVHTMNSKKSVALARAFEKEFSGRAGRHSRGVKDNSDREHTLQVLKYTKMTSVLVECGFLTNVREANYLNTTTGQDIIASALFRGLRTHLQANHPGINFLKSAGKDTDGEYYVQITSSKEVIDTDHASFKKTGEKVSREKLDTKSAYKYRYVIGPYKAKSDAKIVLERVRKKGFPDAILLQKD
jgi:N-acetylmuramoyl-L-alanine amidase